MLQETESLESEQLRLQEEIKVFQREKEELELILNTHRFHCGADTVGSLNSAPHFNPVPVSGGSAQAAPIVLVRPAAPVSLISTGSTVSTVESTARTSAAVNGIPVQSAQTPLTVVMAPIANGNSVSRPTSFPTSSLRTVAMVATSTGPNVLTFGLESMLDGHTGLTPITGMPSCAIAIVGQQMQSMTPNDNVNNAGEATASGLTAL
jgi:fos-like antigen